MVLWFNKLGFQLYYTGAKSTKRWQVNAQIYLGHDLVIKAPEYGITIDTPVNW